MAARKKDPAALRTIGLFSGKTPLEEAEALLEPEDHGDRAPPAVRDIVLEAEEAAMKWLGVDVFHEGDDVKIATKAGAAIIVLVDTAKSKDGSAYGTRSFRLSRAQWTKLKRLVKEAP